MTPSSVNKQCYILFSSGFSDENEKFTRMMSSSLTLNGLLCACNICTRALHSSFALSSQSYLWLSTPSIFIETKQRGPKTHWVIDIKHLVCTVYLVFFNQPIGVMALKEKNPRCMTTESTFGLLALLAISKARSHHFPLCATLLKKTS